MRIMPTNYTQNPQSTKSNAKSNNPAFGTLIEKLETEVIEKHLGLAGLDKILNIYPRLKTLFDDSVKLTLKAGTSFLMEDGYLKVIAEKSLGQLPMGGKIHTVKTSFKLSDRYSCFENQLSEENIFEKARNIFNEDGPKRRIDKFESKRANQLSTFAKTAEAKNLRKNLLNRAEQLQSS